jgi:hypothetical protein
MFFLWHSSLRSLFCVVKGHRLLPSSGFSAIGEPSQLHVVPRETDCRGDPVAKPKFLSTYSNQVYFLSFHKPQWPLLELTVIFHSPLYKVFLSTATLFQVPSSSSPSSTLPHFVSITISVPMVQNNSPFKYKMCSIEIELCPTFHRRQCLGPSWLIEQRKQRYAAIALYRLRFNLTLERSGLLGCYGLSIGR